MQPAPAFWLSAICPVLREEDEWGTKMKNALLPDLVKIKYRLLLTATPHWKFARAEFGEEIET